MKKIAVVFFIFFSVVAYSQPRILAPSGSWQYHLPLHIALDVAQTQSKVYCAAKAGLYFYDKEYNSTGQITKEDGLNDIEISSINYYAPLDILLIAYSNTNIDLIQGNTIININDIFRKQIIGEKKINKISFKNDFAYLACSFGVVVLDLKKLEIKESFQSIGPNGSQIRINDLCFKDSSIYLGTEDGVYYGTLSSTVNLLDFNNWKKFDTQDSLPNLECTSIAAFNDQLFAYFGDTLDSTTFNFSNNSWTLDTRFDKPVRNFTSENELIAIFEKSFKILTKENTISEEINQFGNLSNVIKDQKDNTFWISDLTLGLLQLKDGNINILKPNSPLISSVFAVDYVNDKIYALRGGYDGSKTQLGSPIQIDVLGEYGWATRNYQYDSTTTLFYTRDIVKAAYNSITNKTYYASFGYGLIEEYESEKYNIFNDKNSPLTNVLDSGGFVRVTDLAVDKDGTVWMTNYVESKTASPSVLALKKDETWEKFVFSSITGASYPLKIIIDKKQQKWVLLNAQAGGGILLFDKNNEKRKLLKAVFEQGMLPNDDVRTIAEDEKGSIWIGTTNGVAVFDLADLMFEDIDINTDARTPFFEGRPLLEEVVVSCIAIDKGNRKWIGTPNGLWLFNESGTEAIHNFTQKNSPLPSDNIMDIEINHQTGEVFIVTDLGMISYRGVATTGYFECLDRVNVFPNPVRPDYDGEIAINGLRNNAEIKIVDMAGNLTYETRAFGGGASWNAKNFEGEKVASGIYQILIIGDSKKTSCVTRIAILN